jgi:Signal transduction histidine kinase
MPLIVGDAFVGCLGIYQDITERVESEAKLGALRDRLTRVQDDERARIARELHDDLGQRLALLTIQLSELQQASLDVAPSLAEQLETSRKLSEEICRGEPPVPPPASVATGPHRVDQRPLQTLR